ncbi:ubinuclein-2-like isoform X2 [Mercenaria mercenaria]|uniref:ubinuclein-2-like isoform X2 n=1 Tax=Mercenaria mercenaria TaxID=6596 RepID=UPI00234ECFF0|nr:ubinuclein-2-like isoform X2 [Mercenaria mercenaria]
MEGPKRLQFTTLGPPGKQEKKDVTPKTHRFNLDIPESTDTTCPEFFYTELLKTIPGTEEKPKSDDPFDDDDADKLAAIARGFEEKYNKPITGKKKKKKWQDNYYLEQLGEGYDENDTFIDNSEAYDEVLPETMTTKLGGFYINSGRLELKEMSDSSEDEFRSPLPVKKNKKRRISSDEDSDGEKVVKKKKMKDTLSVDGEVKKKKKKKLIVPPGEKPIKKVKLKDKVKDGKSNAVSALIKTTSPNLNGDSVENGVISSDSDEDDEVKSQMKSNISMVIDSVVAMAANDSNSRGEFEDSMPKKDIDPESIPKLPLTLPSGMEEKIHAKETRDGKCKFFTENVNKLLLEVEMASKQMTVSNRSAMFGHLAAFLPCSKETLLKRAKTLRVKELEDKIKEPLDKLKEAVNRIMPALIEKYEEDCKKVALEKLEEVNKETPKEEKEREGGKEDAATESDEDEKTNQSDTAKKRQTGPRKKFVWDAEVRSLLCDVVRVKMHTYMMSKGKSQTAEEFCKAFLEQDVRPIWPKGWMQTRVLYKESKAAHSLWTNPQKAKKPLLVSKAQAVSASNQISKSPNTPVSSISNSAKMPYVNVSKLNSGSNVLKTMSASLNSAKPVINSQSTPTAPPKKVMSTILDYANSSTETAGVLPISASLIRSSLQGSTEKPSPSMIKISDVKLPGTKQTDSSWDHMVSDILRSSIGGEQPREKSPPKPVIQRQNSNNTPQAASGYMAQFAKYVHTQDTATPKQISPTGNQKLTDTQLMLNEQRKKLAHQQKMHLEAEKQRQIKLLTAQKMELEEKGKQYTQKIAMQLASQKAAFMQTAKSDDQPKMPSQSPMSLAMSKNIPLGQGSSRKQLTGQFKEGNGQHKHLSDNLIRKQLNESSQGSCMLQQVKAIQKQSSGHYVQVSPTSDSLRKTSPQSQTVKITHNSSQGKTGSPHIVTLHSSQSQGPVLFNPAGVTVTTNSRPASSLLKSLFGQAQAQTSSPNFPGPSIQRSPNQGTPSPKVTSSLGQTQHGWSPNSSIQELQARLQSAAGMQTKPYTMPVTSPQAVPGYQSVKLSSLTPEQLQSYQAVQQLRRPTYNKQMSTPGSQNSSDLQHYNSLHHYGYHGYRDGSK